LGTFVSTKGRYAIRALIDLAEHRDQGKVPLKDIAERQGISLKYLETIMPILVKEGIVAGCHGKGGGYELLIPPSECMVGPILRMTEGTISPVSCLHDGKECDRAATCKTLPMWRKLDKMISDYLDTVSIQELMENKVITIE